VGNHLWTSVEYPILIPDVSAFLQVPIQVSAPKQTNCRTENFGGVNIKATFENTTRPWGSLRVPTLPAAHSPS
jgi:hypothetical protein